jgi:hypothetical protein
MKKNLSLTFLLKIDFFCLVLFFFCMPCMVFAEPVKQIPFSIRLKLDVPSDAKLVKPKVLAILHLMERIGFPAEDFMAFAEKEHRRVVIASFKYESIAKIGTSIDLDPTAISLQGGDVVNNPQSARLSLFLCEESLCTDLAKGEHFYYAHFGAVKHVQVGAKQILDFGNATMVKKQQLSNAGACPEGKALISGTVNAGVRFRNPVIAAYRIPAFELKRLREIRFDLPVGVANLKNSSGLNFEIPAGKFLPTNFSGGIELRLWDCEPTENPLSCVYGASVRGAATKSYSLVTLDRRLPQCGAADLKLNALSPY